MNLSNTTQITSAVCVVQYFLDKPYIGLLQVSLDQISVGEPLNVYET